MGSGQITKNVINVDTIKIIQFCLGSWMDGWFNGSIGGVSSYS